MKIRKRGLAAAGVVLGIGSLLAGCDIHSGQTAATANVGGAAASKTPVTITVAAWNDAADSLKAEIPGFEKKYPWIHVQIEYVDGTYQKITPELIAGTAPDIIQTQQRDFPYFLNRFPGQFVSLNSYMGNIEKQIAPVALAPAMQGNKVYAAPWDLGPAAMYYRKDMFKKAGINPNSIKTWADYLAAGKKITQFYHGKVKMLDDNISEPSQGIETTLMVLVSELGGSYVTTKDQIDFTSPQLIKAMDVIQSWGKAGILADAPTWNDQISAFSNNQVATIISPVWYAGTMMNSAPKQSGKWGILPLPAFTAGGPNEADSGGSVLAITKESKNPTAAWDFIQYCLYSVPGENVQLKYGLFPSWETYYTAKGTNFNQNFKYFGMPIYKFFASVSKHIPVTRYGGYFADYSQPIAQAYESVVQGKDPLTALKTAEQSAARVSGQSIAAN
ncbi:ABC transporter substrate-binding protein [Alicyclobacillus acidiphilus]|uniref:ABC transporter substrate-binding protein n=1 Tax=Alicyclobacillus acidiphilus TaxID=182455 RepID=UPI000ABA4671|nr:sugar ABC transporter substrate-binding protein [Alicyclobacillus acidiphilus]